MTYRLHAIPDWASLIPRLVLEEMGQPYEIIPHDYAAGSLNTPAYRALNPNGLIPTLETPDGPIYETAAILLYLTDRHASLAPAPTAPDRAAYLTWLFFTATTLHQLVMQLSHPEDLAGDAHAPAIATAALTRLQTKLAQLEDMLTESTPNWLTPNQPGALGYYLAVILRWAQMLPSDPAHRLGLKPYPRLLAVIRAHETRPAAARLFAAEGLGDTPFSAPKV